MATRERSVSRTLFLPAISLFSAFQMAPSFFSLSSSFFSYVGPISFPFSLSIPVHTQMYIFARKTGNVCVSLSLSLRFLSSFFLVVVAAPAALYIPQSSGQLIEILMDFFSLGASLGHELPAPIADYHQRGTCKIGILLSSSFSILPVSLSLSPSHLEEFTVVRNWTRETFFGTA